MNDSIALHNEDKEEVILKTWQLFGIILFGFLFINFFTSNYIMTRGVYHQLMSEQMESYRIDDYFDAVSKFSIWSYIGLPILLWIKIALVAFLIQLPLMLKFVEIKFKTLFRILLITQIPMFLSAFVKVIWLFLIPYSEYTNELLALVPLSITSIIDTSNFTPAVNGFLNNINLFDFAWIYLLFRELKNTGKIDKTFAFNLAFGVWLGLAVLQLGLMLYLNNG